MRVLDLAGQRFGLLQVLAFHDRQGKERRWLCRCDCGRECPVTVSNLRTGRQTGCGCRVTKHGDKRNGRRVTEYTIWANMRMRCENQGDANYHNYGQRGISVCDRWRGEHGYENFLADMGRRPSPKHSIDRKNNDGNYELGNCRWATTTEQANNRRNSRVLEFNGRAQTVTQWAREIGVVPGVLMYRLKLGWSVDRTLTEPYAPRSWGPRRSRDGRDTDPVVEFRGLQKRATEWASEFGMPPDVVRRRVYRDGWNIERALRQPVRSFSSRVA